MKFTFVIPCYNEGEDVRLALESSLLQNHPEKEVIVVDDSTDGTRAIVDSYRERGVRVIRPDERRGCCEARNIGLKAATGDVVVLLNADVHPPPNLLAHLEHHYAQGADWVILRSLVSNQDTLVGRFIQAQAERMYAAQGDLLYWSEAFSCRREAALAVGGIPDSFPLPFCRDWFFGRILEERGYRKVVDLSFNVPHKAPATLKEFFTQKTRDGRFSILFFHFLRRRSMPALLTRSLAKQAMILALGLALVPWGLRVARLLLVSPKRWADGIGFAGCEGVYRLGYAVGEWRGIASLLHLTLARRHASP
ncbi:MAG: glycosyltransferase family 2 protein [Nitrospirae bacterium]|nr:glycosyltransferase family 2 protein [Nitrospirota bacterium]